MKVALINSRQDKAGVNIRYHIEQLLTRDPSLGCKDRTYEFFEIEERLIHAEHIDATIDADLLVFLSRHYSVNPVPVLTVHVTGNFRTADVGGTARTLAPAAPVMMQATLRESRNTVRKDTVYRMKLPTTVRHPLSIHHSLSK